MIYFPSTSSYPRFMDDVLFGIENDKMKYQLKVDCLFSFHNLKLTDFKDELGRFEIYNLSNGKEVNETMFKIKKGTQFDGVTGGADYDNRMMFALVHDCACWATEQSEDHSYRDALNNQAYSIVRAQGGGWWNAKATSWAVKRYSKHLKKVGKYVG